MSGASNQHAYRLELRGRGTVELTGADFEVNIYAGFPVATLWCTNVDGDYPDHRVAVRIQLSHGITRKHLMWCNGKRLSITGDLTRNMTPQGMPGHIRSIQHVDRKSFLAQIPGDYAASLEVAH